MNLSSHWSWSISEVNAGGYYYDSDSEGSTWSPIPMKTDYFTMVRQHTYGDWSIVKAATCTETGLKKRTCAGCGTAETQVTSALGHLWENNYYTGADNGTYYKRCVRNGCNSKTDVKNNPYTVTFLSNNGEEKTEVQDFVYNITQPLKANNFKKDHHSFINWSEQPDGRGAVYYDKESVNNLTPVYSGNLQLYAQWQPDQYDITYHDSLDGTQNITKALSYTLNLGELPVFTRPGYTQIGFGTDRTGGEKITEPIMPSGHRISMILYFIHRIPFGGAGKRQLPMTVPSAFCPRRPWKPISFWGGMQNHTVIFIRKESCSGSKGHPISRRLRKQIYIRLRGIFRYMHTLP